MFSVMMPDGTVNTIHPKNKTGPSATSETRVTESGGEENDIIHVQPRRHVANGLPITPEPTSPEQEMEPSSTSGMDDINFTSSSTHKAPTEEGISAPKNGKASFEQPHSVAFAIRRLTAGSPNTKGSADNPIILDEFIPLHKPVTPPPRKHIQAFQKRRYNVSKSQKPIIVPDPVPAIGNTFTGEKGQDQYRMMTAKASASKLFFPEAHEQANYDVPFAIKYPLLAHHIAHPPPKSIPSQSTFNPHLNRMSMSLTGDYEGMLRRRAVQHIRESSRPEPHKKKLSDDLDETSASEPDINTNQTQAHVRRPLSKLATRNIRRDSRKKLIIYQDPPNPMTPLVTQTSLLASLLHVYSKSADKKGLREDIAMLVSATNQRLTEWMKAESEASGKRRRSDTVDEIDVESTTSEVGDVRPAAKRVRKDDDTPVDKDAEVRSLLRADAGIWQNGSSQSVADVFGRCAG